VQASRLGTPKAGIFATVFIFAIFSPVGVAARANGELNPRRLPAQLPCHKQQAGTVDFTG
jgi:hypothetical protein